MTQEIASFQNKSWESPIDLCLDLNIWCAALLADRKGKEGTASQILVEIVKQGFCNLGLVQLVISWGMLNRLRWVLEKDLSITQLTADLYIDAIRGLGTFAMILLDRFDLKERSVSVDILTKYLQVISITLYLLYFFSVRQ